jgi:acetylcholinesterase
MFISSIIVSFEYLFHCINGKTYFLSRVGTFGFLYTGTDDAPGNMGLWDQALALKWVNKNIKYFGGDPKKITVFGDSAGSWSTSLHIVSPITRNLFKNAIMMSGSSINNMAGDEPQNVMKGWLKGAQLIGCADEENDSENSFTPKMIECLKNSDPKQLFAIPFLPELTEGRIGWMLQVIVDGQFLPKKPLSLLKSGNFKKNLNLLIGTAEDEGSFVLPIQVDNVKYDYISPQNLTYREAFDELKQLVPRLSSKFPVNGQNVAKLYFTGLSDNNDFDLLRRTIGIAIGDYLLGCPTLLFARYLFKSDKKNSKIYQYYYKSKLGDPRKMFCTKWMGTCHGDGIWPVFGVPFSRYDSHVEREREISAQMIDFFSHFSRKGLEI